MTAKEQLLLRAQTWTDEQAEIALHAVEGDGPGGEIVDAWGNLSAMADAAAADLMQRLDEEERAAGHPPWER